MPAIESLGLSANQWKFLYSPDKYIKASNDSKRKLVPESTGRQFRTARDILARLNGSNKYKEDPRRGILLADDVGLGKTTVAALVAWVVASAGEKRGVRILAPNDVMVRRWEEELLSHVEPLQRCAPALGVRANRIKARKGARLSAGSIQVVKHSYAASKSPLTCDLLIVDEAHRAKGKNTEFSKQLNQQRKHARRVLILTATPFSIHLDELRNMLVLIGGESAYDPVHAFSGALTDLYSGNTARNPDVVAARLATKSKAAVDALSSVVIRHGIDDLPSERVSFGQSADWKIDVRPAESNELELMIRMDRALRLARKGGSDSAGATNDPRFHVGWQHFDEMRKSLLRETPQLLDPAKTVVAHHLSVIKRLRGKVGIHPKLAAVANEVKSKIEMGEKVILFCHHHATARELTVHLASVLPEISAPRLPSSTAWKKAWDKALNTGGENLTEGKLRETFIEWLCADLIRAQTWNWIRAASRSEINLAVALKRHHVGAESIAEAAQRLYHALLQSKSSRAVLKAAGDRDRLEFLPGANGASRVLGVCDPCDNADKNPLFIHNQQPDTVISIFNSPFGPDVLVVTDKLSEGIDLHRCCRQLVHYELDPSPIRTVQRNGRLRRVNSWAAISGQPILYAYPAFRGTRDFRLVQIMKKRIDSFSLLLGGVPDFDVDEVVGSEEKWRNEVIAKAKKRLASEGHRLIATEPTIP